MSLLLDEEGGVEAVVAGFRGQDVAGGVDPEGDRVRCAK